jgi:predicted transcriptional regulator
VSPAFAVCARLREAGLLHVADRVAAEHDITSGVILTITGRVAPAQAALFRALAAEGQDAAAIARLLGWGETAVSKTLGMPEPRPTPEPDSGARDPFEGRIRRSVDRRFVRLRADLRDSEAARRALAEKLAVMESRLRCLERRLDIDPASASLPVADAVIRAVAAARGLGPAALNGRNKRQVICQARAEAAWRLKHLHGCTLEEIGRALGGRDHSTIYGLLHNFQPSAELVALLPEQGKAAA